MLIFLLLLMALTTAAATARLVARRDYSRSVQGFNVALRRLDHVRLTAGGKSVKARLDAEPSGNVRVVPTSPRAGTGNGRSTRASRPSRPVRARTVRH
jgi:hypothetical protein